MITLKRNSGSQSGMRMKATPRATKQNKTKKLIVPTQNAFLPFRLRNSSGFQSLLDAHRLISNPTTQSGNLQLELWILLRSLRLLFCTAKFKTVEMEFSLPALI